MLQVNTQDLDLARVHPYYPNEISELRSTLFQGQIQASPIEDEQAEKFQVAFIRLFQIATEECLIDTYALFSTPAMATVLRKSYPTILQQQGEPLLLACARRNPSFFLCDEKADPSHRQGYVPDEIESSIALELFTFYESIASGSGSASQLRLLDQMIEPDRSIAQALRPSSPPPLR
ncbi:MAG: hypothetical protein S4CHLAM102_08330 [Chlamydiia bacterium]|nr:hypothetical protein [Chlamydiia bacterium]